MVTVGQVILGFYGVLLVLGGVMGMVKVGSRISLFAGGGCGLASLVALWISLEDPSKGFLIGGVLPLLLTGIFAGRFFRTWKLVPAGVVFLLSLAVGILIIYIQQNLAR